MHRTLGLLPLLLGASFAAAAAPPEDRVQQEEKKLAGTWRVVSAESGGAVVPNKEFRGVRITYKDGKFTVRKDGKEVEEGAYKLDPTANPRTMDISPKRGRAQLGIYVLTRDTLKICSCVSGKERPTDFETRNKPDCTLMLLKREP